MEQITTILFAFIFSLAFWGIADGQIIYSDNFTGEDDKGQIGLTSDLTGVDWNLDVSDGAFEDNNDFFAVKAGVFEAQDVDGDVIWTSESFNINGYNNLEFSFDAGAIGDFEASGDIFDVEIVIDGGTPETLFSATVDENATDDPMYFGTVQLTASLQNFTTGIVGSGTDAVIRITVNNNADSERYRFDNLSVIESSIIPQPSNHVVDFNASSSSISEINLSWTDATGGTIPENYVVIINDSGIFTDPSDGIPQSDDTDLSDGNGVLNVAYGVESATFSNLNSNTQYYFQIYPYTNLGTNIDYKTDGSVPSATISTLEKPSLVLNEIFSDPANDLSGDANNDGTRSSDDDEFLEFVNNSSSHLNISNWTIFVGSSEKHTFPSEPATILGPDQAIVVFGGGDPTGVFGGSLVQTTSSLGLANSGETITVEDETDNTLIEHLYVGASDQSETRNPDISGNFEDHTSADTDDNSAFSPGTRIDGSTFQTSETLSVTFADGEGWRMISAPTSGNSYDDLLHNIWTQGTNGADYSDGEPNVMTFDGSSFTAVNNLESDLMVSGQGFLVYIYSDDDHNQSPADNKFPKTISYSGVPRTGYVEAPLYSGNDNWTLTGNPYNQPISWDNLSKSDLYGTVYIYDHTYGIIDGGGDDIAEDGSIGGGYRTWNGTSGSLTDGIIAPFQGFWVQSSGLNPSLIFEESTQTTGGTFYSKENENPISLRLRSETGNMFNETFLSFSDVGNIGKDRFDGLKLSPLDHKDYISISTDVGGTQMDINNLPVELYKPIEIPLYVEAFEAVESGWAQMSGEVTLSWPELKNIPAEWEIILTDLKLNRTIHIRESKEYSFKTDVSYEKINEPSVSIPFDPVPFRKEKAVDTARFRITINPNTSGRLIDNDIPAQYSLEQNYPNPFNPTTNIKFKITETSDVTLSIFNVMGQRVATLVNELKNPGTYEVSWNASDMASGIYYYRLRAGGMIFNRQMTLIK